ncbi:MAG: amidohydrolase, partial [Sphingobium sp.]
TVISREKDAGAFGVITVGAFNAGTVGNIIPDSANLKLSLRSFSAANRTILNDGVRRTAKAVSDMAGASAPDINYLSGTAAVVNDPAMIRRLGAILTPIWGNQVEIAPASAPGGAASEDFSAFIDAGIPSIMIGIGSFSPDMIADYKHRGAPLPVNHSPYFAPDPVSAIRTGVTVLTLAVLDAAQPK